MTTSKPDTTEIVTKEDASSAEFEGNNWRQARNNFRAKHEDNAKLRLFLQNKTDGPDVKGECLKLKHISENKYQQGLGGILENIDALMNLGDIAIKSAPESVGLAWMGVRMCLRAVQGDWATFQLFSGACADVIGIMISCRVYGKMYGGKNGPKDFQELHEKVVDFIPLIYTEILEFSYSVHKYTQKSSVIRIGAQIFKDVKGGFEGQINGIKTSDVKMREFAKTASERMMMHLQNESLKGQDIMKSQLESLKETLNASLRSNEAIVRCLFEELEEEKKDTRKKTPYEKAQDLYEENMGYLNPSEAQYELLQENIDVLREPGTCQWIFDLKEYKTWHDSPESSMVWVSGEGGYGKSIVMSTVIEQLQAKHTDSSKAVVQYFFCKAGTSVTQNTEQVFKTVVAQLYENCLAFPELLERANVAINKGLGKKDRKSVVRFSFEVAFGGLLEAMERDVFVVIDALDECIDRREEQLLQKLRTVVESAKSKVKIMVCSRPHADIGIDLRGIPNIKCEGNNKPDIEKNITTQMRSFPGWTMSEKRYAIQQIVEKSGGQFKFVQVALEFLRRPLVRPFEPTIDQLPNGLDGSYITSWNSTNPYYRELLKTALTWTLFADGSVPVPVIMDAYSRTYSFEAGVKEEVEVKEESQTGAGGMDLHEKQVRIAGGQFLEVSISGHVTLRHLTVRDFFVVESEDVTLAGKEEVLSESSATPKHPNQRSYGSPWTISKRQGHLEILKVIVQSLTSPVFQKKYLLPYSRGGRLSRPDWLEPSDSEVDEETREARWNVKELRRKEREAYYKEAKINKTETRDSDVQQPTQDEDETNEQNPRDIPDLIMFDEPEFDSRKLVGYGSPASEDDSDDELDKAPTGMGLMLNKQYRYELTHWIHHLREAQALWSVKDQQENEEWRYIWDKLFKFMYEQRTAFKAWLRLLCSNDNSIPYLQICRGNLLHVAAFLGLSSLVRTLIARGYTIDQPCLDLGGFGKGLDGYLAPLDFAVYSNNVDVETVKLLVDRGADVNCTNRSLGRYHDFEVTPFHMAVSKQPTKDFIEYLLAHGADPTMKDKDKRTAVHHFSYNGTDPGALRLLLEARPDIDLINLTTSYQRQTPLHILAERKNDLPLDLLEAYLKAKADVNIDDKQSMRPLHKLALYGNAPAVKLLIKYGADIQDLDNFGQTAFHAAAQSGNVQTLEALLEKGSQVNLADKNGRTPLFLACRSNNEETAMYLIEQLEGQPENELNKSDVKGSTPLREAASKGNANIVKRLLSEMATPAAAINAGDAKYQQNSMHKAAVKGRKAALQVLIEQGGDLSLNDKNGLTPFQLCIRFWNEKREESIPMEETLSFLIKSRAPPSSELNTLIFTAAAKGSVRIIESLLNAGVNPKFEDDHGWTPAMLAEHHGQQSVVDLLSKPRKQVGKRPSGWADMGQRIAISDDRLAVRPIGPKFYGKTVVSDHPTPATDMKYYFEIEIAYDETAERNPKIDERLAIGATTLPAILNAACLTRTWDVEKKEYSFKQSYGWDPIANCRHKFCGGYPKGPRNVSREPGDVVGCGIDYAQKRLFFTNNGVRLDEKLDFTDVAGRLYPAVSIEGRYIAKANFGSKPFRWTGWKAWSTSS